MMASYPNQGSSPYGAALRAYIDEGDKRSLAAEIAAEKAVADAEAAVTEAEQAQTGAETARASANTSATSASSSASAAATAAAGASASATEAQGYRDQAVQIVIADADQAMATAIDTPGSATETALSASTDATVQGRVDTAQSDYWVKAQPIPNVVPTGASRLIGERAWNPAVTASYALSTTPTYFGSTNTIGQRDVSVDFKCPASGTIRFTFDTFVSVEGGTTLADDVYFCSIISGDVPPDSKKVALRRTTSSRTVTTNSATGSPNLGATSGNFRPGDVGSAITRANVPSGTTIVSVTSDTAAVMSANATAGGSAVATLSTHVTSGARVQYEYVWRGLIPGATYTAAAGGYVSASNVVAKVIAGGIYGPTMLRVFEDSPAEINPFGASAVRGPDPLSVVTSDTKYNSFPGLVKCPNGDLLVGYRKGTSHLVGSEGLGFKRSTNTGATWSTETLLTNGAYDLGTCSLSVVDVGGVQKVALVTWLRTAGASPIQNGTRIYLSGDNGATWEAPITVDTGTWLEQWSVSESALVKWNGYYYLGVWGYNAGAPAGLYESGVIRSTDLVTWERVLRLTNDGIPDGFNELGVSVFPDRLVALVRLESTYAIWESTSYDGASWSKPVPARGGCLAAPKTMMGLWNGINLMPLRYKSFGNATYGHGFLAGLNAEGDVSRLAHLEVSGAFMYGQAAMVDTNRVGVAWASESSSSDCRIYYDEYDLTLV